MIQKTFGCTVKDVTQSQGGTRALIAVSCGDEDRDGEFVHPEGGKTPAGIQLLYGHNWSQLRANIGVIEKGEAVGNEYLNHVRFDDNIPEHTDAIIAAKKAKNKTLNTFSIGFEPELVKKPDGRMLKISRGDWTSSEKGQHILEWTQLELSAVPVPSSTGTYPISVRGLVEDKALELTIRKALDSILGSDEFLSRMKSILASPKSGAGEGGTTASGNPPADPSAAAATRTPSDPELDLDALLAADPIEIAMRTDNPEAVVRALAAASGDGALDDLDAFFNEAVPAGAGDTGA